MRASRVFSARPERAIVALAQLCEERKDGEIVHPDGSNQISPPIPPRLSPIPAQTPYTVGSTQARLNADATPHIPQYARNLVYQQQTVGQRLATLPGHATANHPNWNDPVGTPTAIRPVYVDGVDDTCSPVAVYGISNDASSDTSDIITDDEMMETFLDSVDDVRSYLDESPELTRTPSPASSQPPAPLPVLSDTDDISESFSQALLDDNLPDASGSESNDASHVSTHVPFPLIHLKPPQPAHVIPSRIDTVKRVSPKLASLPALTIPFGYTYSSSSSCAYYHRRPASSPSSHLPNPGNQIRQQYPQCSSHHQSPQTVFYETTGPTPPRHSNHINHFNHYNNAELAITHPYHYAYHSATPFHQQFERSPQQQQRCEGPIPGPSRQIESGLGGELISVKNLPQHAFSARKRNSRRSSISDCSSGRLSWKEAGGSTNGNTRSNTPTTSSMTPPPYPRSSSRDSPNLSRPPSRVQHSHSTSNVTVKPGSKQHQHGGHGQSVQQQSYRLRNGSVPSSPVVHQDYSSPFSSPLQQQQQPPSHPTSRLHPRKDIRNSPFSGHLNSPLRGSPGQPSNLQGDISFNDEVSEVVYKSRASGSPCASVSNGSATTRSAIDSSPGSISSTSSSLQSTFNRPMTEDSGIEAASPFQSGIRRLPSSQHRHGVRRNGEGSGEITVEGVNEGYRMMPQNLQELMAQKGRGGMEDWQTFQDRVGVQQGGGGQAQLQSEESARRLQQTWKEHQARKVMDRNGAVYHQPQTGMTMGLKGRKVPAVGDKRGKKW